MSINDVLVSVVIPTYNRAGTILNAIDSVLAQTYKSIEIIVVDDGSTDNTNEILSQYGDKIKYIYKINGGVSSARNAGIKEAKGEYIALFDSDDSWSPVKIEKQMAYLLEHPGYGIAISDIEYWDEDSHKVKVSKLRETIARDGYILEFVLKLPVMTCSYMLIKKEVFNQVGYFDESFKTADDFDMILRICSKYKAVLIEEPLIKYKKSDNSVSHRLFSGNRLRAIEKLYTYAPEFVRENKELLEQTKASINMSYAEDLLWHRYIKEAQKQVLESMYSHFTLRALMLFLKSIIISFLSLLSDNYKDKGKFSDTQKVNLLFINYSFNIGGIETLILNMCKVLDKDKFNIYICSFKEDNVLENEFKDLGIPIHIIAKKEGIDISLIFKLRKLLRKLNIDIVHTHNSAQWFYGVLACIGLHKPYLIHTQHSVLEKGRGKLLYSLRYLAKKTAFIVCVAKYVADYMLNEGRLNTEKVKVIYNGITIDRFAVEINKQQIKSSLNIPHDCKLIGIIARLALIKDHRTLLDAFKYVVQKINNVKLLVVGDGELLKKLEEYSKELAIENKVIFLGKKRDIPEILNILDLFVLSSVNEGMSITLLEAMAASLPIVATEVGGNSEVVVHNKTGILVPSQDPEKMASAINELLTDCVKANEMGKEGKNRVLQKFSIENMVKEYQTIYNNLAFNK